MNYKLYKLLGRGLIQGFAGELRICTSCQKGVFVRGLHRRIANCTGCQGGSFVQRFRRRIANCTDCQKGFLYKGFADELRIRTGVWGVFVQVRKFD